MKTKHILFGLALSLGFLPIHAQIMTTTLTSYGDNAGDAGSSAVYYGKDAGDAVTSGGLYNCFFGHQAGRAVTSGDSNVFMGYRSGYNTNTGTNNILLGHSAGYSQTTAGANVFLGRNAGYTCTTGGANVYIGYNAGQVGNGESNVYVGANTGVSASGSRNVFIGFGAGIGITSNDILVIDNEAQGGGLQYIWGDFANHLLKLNSTVGINFNNANFPATAGGVSLSTYKLMVKGGILADEVRVTPQTAWADYVFEDDYKLASLEEVECFIEENGHLPNVPSAKQVREEGIEVGQMATIQQEKIEELTLYIIEMNKQMKQMQEKIERLEAAENNRDGKN